MAAAAVIRATTPRTISVNMEPASTGLASVSFSNWRQVPEVVTMACQPETGAAGDGDEEDGPQGADADGELGVGRGLDRGHPHEDAARCPPTSPNMTI